MQIQKALNSSEDEGKNETSLRMPTERGRQSCRQRFELEGRVGMDRQDGRDKDCKNRGH